MQNKGLVKFIALIFALVSIYQLSFTFVTNHYEKKAREANKELKEYRLSVTIDVGDFETRRKNAKEYLEKGHKIRAFIRFKGRQMARPELGRDVLLKFADALSEVSVIETEPKQEGRQIAMILAPKKKEGN